MIVNDRELSRLVEAGLAAAHRGEVARARALFENLLLYKDFAPVHIGLALTYLVAGDFGQAETILKNDVLAANPADADALALLGLTLSFAGRVEEGAALFERVPKEGAAGKLVATFSSFSA
ncbi:hypothetical protein AGMMS50256_23580 [Betaproteobacteria bacterium]|nr:hypothetical protein AGMMS50256_23580 [Betaproteobacteria bacterium]